LTTDPKLVRRLEALEASHTAVAEARKRSWSTLDLAMEDPAWTCEKCGQLLGFIDLDCKAVRLRQRDGYVWVKLGQGGQVKATCRRCAHVNAYPRTGGQR